MNLYLLQYESGIAYYIKNESIDDEDEGLVASKYEVWVGHVKTSNLERVIQPKMQKDVREMGDDVNFFYGVLAKGEETPVECLTIVDVSERTQFHFMVRSREDFQQN